MDEERPSFHCTGCGYEFSGPQFAITITIDCPNCEGQTVANKFHTQYDVKCRNPNCDEWTLAMDVNSREASKIYNEHDCKSGVKQLVPRDD